VRSAALIKCGTSCLGGYLFYNVPDLFVIKSSIFEGRVQMVSARA